MAPLAPANKRIILIPIDDSEVNMLSGCDGNIWFF